jgi:DNA-binding response OmpR family regulator
LNRPLVLVVDDEARIREIARRYLEADGCAVIEASDGEEALARFEERRPDVVILDIMLPGIDGIEVLRRLRTRSDVYTIMLTARAEEVDRLVGLSVGADDYVTKPFSPRELAARVRAVLRRPRGSPPAPEGALRFDGLTIDEERREVLSDGHVVELSALEFDLLAALAESPGRVFTRQKLLERVWGYDFYGDERVVDVHIRNLRRAMGDDADAPRFIGTVRGVGYRFVGTAAKEPR